MTAQRVVVWATGGIGSIAIHAIQRRPNLDLVGVWVHSPEKDGKDAGELANGDPIGLATTNDADALLALKPDCVIYAASGPERDALAIPDYVKFLSAGVNVVTTSTTRLVNPHAYEPAEWRDQLVAAAKQGQVSLYASGIEPGFAADYLPLVLSTQSGSKSKRSASISTARSPTGRWRSLWAPSKPARPVRCGCGRPAWSTAA